MTGLKQQAEDFSPAENARSSGFEGLLELLGPDRAAAAEKYRSLHGRIVRLYEWRGCASSEELADQTFDRVIDKLESGEEIRNPEGYIVRVASFVFKETVRREIRQRKALEKDRTSPLLHPVEPEEVAERDEHRQQCFRSCLDGLKAEKREHLVRYYSGEKGQKIRARRRLGEELGLKAGALRIRMYRLRQRLEGCITSCLEAGG
jgi:DNA-directed RNA polymerase specialized sigma24 family protein